MRILIHAVPERLWYVEEFMIPTLEAQGSEEIGIYNDIEHLGNLEACLRAFETREGDGGTWHLQDDVLVCRDFVSRCRELDEGVVFGFACRNFGDRLDAWGRVYAPDAWHSFQCVRIPDVYARECAAWIRSGDWERESACPELPVLMKLGKGDDTFFHEFMIARHFADVVQNVRPNLVEHVDWLLGGSTIQHWRDYLARAEYWADPELVEALRRRIRARAAKLG